MLMASCRALCFQLSPVVEWRPGCWSQASAGQMLLREALNPVPGFSSRGAPEIGAGVYGGTRPLRLLCKRTQPCVPGSLQGGDAGIGPSWGAVLGLAGCPVDSCPEAET